MSRLFLTLLNSSITASWLILAVFIIRLLLKKAPKWMICLLWGVVAVRLIVPFSIESALSLIPSAKTIPMDIEYLAAPTVNTGIAPVDQVVNPIIVEQFAPKEVGNSVNPMQVVTSFATVVWIVGFALMLLYASVIYIRLNKRVSAAAKVQNHVYRCDEIDSPFILGVIRTRIYLPSNLDEGLYDNILSHEYAHLKRRDHYWKPLGYILLSVYWFNPLCWLSYIILCKDIELACDEKATKEMDKNQRALYCETLLACSVNRKLISVCPVAFGEVCVKERIKSVLNYKKPAFWIVLAAIVCCVAVVVCFLTNPVDDDGNEFTESGSNREVAIESTKGIERTESDELAGEKRAFIEKWASAFVDRDGQMIKDFSSEAVKEAFIERGLLYEEDDYVSFGMSSPWPMWNDEETGYRIMQLDESANYAEILYYASTSEPHVIVWKEKIVFDAKDETMIVKDEELHYFDYIASGYEFNEAYPAIKGTLMDYSSNGLGEKLNDNALLSSSNIYKQLTDPVEAARILLNLLENENKVKIETLQDDNGADVQNIKITFAEDGVEKIITMIRPWGEYGIWIPQDYGKDAKPDIAEVVDRVLGEYDLADAYDWNNTVEFKTDEDILIKMAEDSTKRYEAYGVISAEYGSYGIILNDKTDGKNNVNYVYEPWFYTGAPADEPVLEWVDDKLLFVYPVEAGEFIQKQQLCYVDCGYETAHMSVVKFDESDLENQV